MRASDAIDIKAAFERMDPVMMVTFLKVARDKRPAKPSGTADYLTVL
jgi:hypothetical protein